MSSSTKKSTKQPTKNSLYWKARDLYDEYHEILGLTKEQRPKWVGSTKEQLEKYPEFIQSKIEEFVLLKQETEKLAKAVGYKIVKPKEDTIKSWKELYGKIKKSVNKKKLIDELIRKGEYDKIVELVLKFDIKPTYDQASRIVNNIRSKGRSLIEIEFVDYEGQIHTKILTINDENMPKIVKALTKGFTVEKVAELITPSDAIEFKVTFQIINIRFITPNKPSREVANKDGSFFPYINTTKIDLSKYQIYNQDQAYDETIVSSRDHCLIHSFRENNVSEEIINNIKLAYLSKTAIPKKDLGYIASLIGRDIILHYYCTEDNNALKPKLRTQEYKTKTDEKTGEPIMLALYENHYFKYEDTEYTKFSIDNYEKVKDEENFKDITKIRGKYFIRENNPSRISSLLLVHKLKMKNYFQKLDLSLFEEASRHKELKNHVYLDNIENEQRPFEKKLKDKPIPNIFYADCESFTAGCHELYLLGVVSNDNDFVYTLNVCDERFITEDNPTQALVYAFLSYITKGGKEDALCYFHNLKYDYHLLEPYLNIRDRCEKDNQIYNVELSYKGKKVELRDSLKLLPFPLSKFSKEFSLDGFNKKEAIAYTYYTKERNNQRIKIQEYVPYLKVKDRKTFNEVVKEDPSYLEEDDTFNPTEYYIEYLKLDCLVLKKGLQKFNQIIEEQTGLTIYDSLTISSLTDKYMIENGVYKGIYEICGNLREYTSKASYGGRVHVNDEYKKKVLKGKFTSLDGVSLYPSAIQRLCREIGLPIGPAKRLSKEQLNQWDKFTYAILSVKINKVNKEQQIPFIAVKGEGVIKYTNEPPNEPVRVDSITLQDYIKFHKIEYEVLEGIYWDEGGNKKMGEVISSLFKQRLEFKKDNPALANTIKLMLNSAYGKTIMKKTKTQKVIVKNNVKTKDKETGEWVTSREDQFNNYLYNHFNTIKGYRQINDNTYEVTKMCADFSYNRGHIGAAILSMSKRIMNEIFDIATDLNIPIYYTDTDSMHCNVDDVPKIEAEYRRRYNKELIGKDLEQFHPDLQMKDSEGNTRDAISTISIFLGKKSYIDVLAIEDKDGNLLKDKDGNILTDYHIRLKGVTKEGLHYAAKQYENGLLGLYEELAQGKEKDLILNPTDEETNETKVLFKYENGRVMTRKEFIRKVKF